MQVYAFSTLDELAPYAESWDRLAAGVPFRSWDWMSCWWRHYGDDSLSQRPRRQLFVLGVFDGDRLAGLAPWYLHNSATLGRTIRWLGSGEVCSDYVSVLCRPDTELPVVEALAEFLSGETGDAIRDRWDMLDIIGVDAADRPVTGLMGELRQRGYTVHCRPGANCWRLDLPRTWEDYLAMLSKGHRKQLRRLQRRLLDSGRAVLHTVDRLDELPRALEVLMDLHQRRRLSLGERGCFASPRFAAFHREVMPRLLRNGQLQLHWLELDRRAVAAEYDLAGDGVTYVYQAGIEPQALDAQPGRLITLATLRRAIAQGYRAIDFLRGDESYKAHFRAAPRPALAARVVAARPAAQLRHGLWVVGKNVKQWFSRGRKPAARSETAKSIRVGTP